jgi:serine/threonine protein kinase
MGVVLKGHDPKLAPIVAIKVLAPELASNATTRQRFRREARTVAAVTQPHIVTIRAVEQAQGKHVDHRSECVHDDSTLGRVFNVRSLIAVGVAVSDRRGLAAVDFALTRPKRIAARRAFESRDPLAYNAPSVRHGR